MPYLWLVAGLLSLVIVLSGPVLGPLLLMLFVAGVFAYRNGALDKAMVRVGIALGVWLAVGATAAFAAADSTIYVGGFYEEYIKPTVVSIIGVVAVGLLGIVWTWAKAHWALLRTQKALEIEAQARTIVQRAAENGAGRVIAKYDGPLANLSFDVKSPIIAAEANNVAQKIGPQLKTLNITPDMVEKTVGDLIAGKVGILQAAGSPAATAPAATAGSL